MPSASTQQIPEALGITGPPGNGSQANDGDRFGVEDLAASARAGLLAASASRGAPPGEDSSFIAVVPCAAPESEGLELRQPIDASAVRPLPNPAAPASFTDCSKPSSFERNGVSARRSIVNASVEGSDRPRLL